jgi:hypothetical protein
MWLILKALSSQENRHVTIVIYIACDSKSELEQSSKSSSLSSSINIEISNIMHTRTKYLYVIYQMENGCSCCLMMPLGIGLPRMP